MLLAKGLCGEGEWARVAGFPEAPLSTVLREVGGGEREKEMGRIELIHI